MENWTENYDEFRNWATSNGWLYWKQDVPDVLIFRYWLTMEGNIVRVTINKDNKITAISK